MVAKSFSKSRYQQIAPRAHARLHLADYNDSQVKRRQKNPKLSLQPRTFTIVLKRRYNQEDEDPDFWRPCGSRTAQVWRDGEKVDYQLYFQYDPGPYDSDEDFDLDLMYPKKTFKPIGSDEWIEPSGWIRLLEYLFLYKYSLQLSFSLQSLLARKPQE
jgi:hypothetical protein